MVRLLKSKDEKKNLKAAREENIYIWNSEEF